MNILYFGCAMVDLVKIPQCGTAVLFRFSVICAGRNGVSISWSWYSDQVRMQDIHPTADTTRVAGATAAAAAAATVGTS